jgi:ABC-type multidrug transport system fused ATPase/permease subunit
VPFVVITVSATLQGFDRNLTRAAAALGARPLYAFRRVTLPVISPGVIVGALFAFAISFDEVVVTVFLVGPLRAHAAAPDVQRHPREPRSHHRRRGHLHDADLGLSAGRGGVAAPALGTAAGPAMMSTDDPIVEFRNVYKTYDGETLVIKDLSFEVRRGEFLTLLGPSGSGKTTT